ncbi:MAG: hypothetical protein HY700_14170 [Gemmatimonadetes bacterium]|nr:hypothetical protein [Gemmatimonadota bacterium]
MPARNLVLSVALLCAFATVVHAQKEKKLRRDPRRITAEEIAAKQTAQTAYDLVQALRPTWLSSRGATTILLEETGISVYVDGTKRGSIDELRSIPRDQVQEMRFLSATDAATRYGLNNQSGAIEVTTKRG